MSSNIHFDFSDKELSSEERLAGLLALDRGLIMVLENLLKKIDGYHDLLEEEVFDNEAAKGYLGKSREALSSGSSWLSLLKEGFRHNEEDLEAIDVPLLVSGAVKRCSTVLGENKSIELKRDVEEVLVNGSLFKLQDLFVKSVISLINHAFPERENTWVHVTSLPLAEEFFTILQSDRPAGDYLLVAIGGDEKTPSLADAKPFLSSYLTLQGSVDVASDTGLPLLETYGILAAHGGEAAAFFNDRGELDSVVFALPVISKRKDMQAPHNIEDTSLMGSETILLVDDEDMIWDVIIDMLQELGYTVLLAGNGKEGLEVYRENPGLIDLVLLDMLMPEMDGHQAFFELKKINPDVKALLSSGYVSEDEARDVLDAGAAGFLQKPYKMEELARKIRAIFQNG